MHATSPIENAQELDDLWRIPLLPPLSLIVAVDSTFLSVMPHTRCRLRLLKLERIKDYLVMEQEFIQNQERLKPQEEKNQVGGRYTLTHTTTTAICTVFR